MKNLAQNQSFYYLQVHHYDSRQMKASASHSKLQMIKVYE